MRLALFWGVLFALFAALFALYVAMARDKPSGGGPFDYWIAAFITARRVEVPQGCVHPAYAVGSEGYRRQTGEESQTTLFLCLRAVGQRCNRFSLFRDCPEVVWPAEVRAVPGLADFLVEAHRAPCRVMDPDVARQSLRRWRETGYFPQDVVEGQAPLLQRDGCDSGETYIMTIRP